MQAAPDFVSSVLADSPPDWQQCAADEMQVPACGGMVPDGKE
jgi:hypothetical protein